MSLSLPNLERIVLTGFMGSGKSTVGRLLAEKLQWQFTDLDTVVEEIAGKSLPAIFAEEGEEAFRAYEHHALASLLIQPRIVLALGGGAPEMVANRDLLTTAEQTLVVLLEAPFEVLLQRCLVQAEDPAATVRPILASHAAAAERFERRVPHYRAVAHEIVLSEALNAEQTVDAIIALLKQST
ncbi:MAG: shikimate kinase [Acidobacteriaceae bacterium]|nr:shikimate kinase [Acidobacteriaceae bacterium]